MLSFKVKGNFVKSIMTNIKIKKNLPLAHQRLNEAILTDCIPYMPMVSGGFVQSTVEQAQPTIKSNMLLVGAEPMGNYLYYGKVMVDEHGRGAIPFEDEYGGIMFRHRKGAILHATNRDLNYTRAYHPQAGARWFEKAKAVHLKDWTATVKDTLLNGK